MRVLVTRPQPGTGTTAARLAALGHQAELLPLSRIEPAKDGAPAAAGFAFLIFTSQNGVRHARLSSAGAPACYCVGGQTAKSARAAGFTVAGVCERAGELAAMIVTDGRVPPGPVLYPCGDIRRPDAEAGLAAAGFTVTPAVVYHAATLMPEAGETARLAAGAAFDAVLFHAPSAAAQFSAWLASCSTAASLFSAARLICLSDAVSAALGPALRVRAEIAETPDEAALFARLCGNAPCDNALRGL